MGDSGSTDSSGFLLKLDNAEMNTEAPKSGLVEKRIQRTLTSLVKERVFVTPPHSPHPHTPKTFPHNPKLSFTQGIWVQIHTKFICQKFLAGLAYMSRSSGTNLCFVWPQALKMRVPQISPSLNLLLQRLTSTSLLGHRHVWLPGTHCTETDLNGKHKAFPCQIHKPRSVAGLGVFTETCFQALDIT